MKIALASLLVAVPAAAFAPSISRPVLSTSLSAKGAAKSAEEDLELTLKVIMDSMQDDGSGIDDSDADDDTPAAAPAAAASSSGVKLWSVDYDAAARLAYEAAGSKGDFASFKSKYLEETSKMVGKKKLL
jgi:hypothetical protein